ncbi:hypothetical protein CYLTODRAFT_367819 [Cylindrobasidium torrendii FP15055 ss-10]|uniref:Fumarylacetoacetase-like C-terminal domain-containing protein n=1 Tax=Cylindrobasidium torrendii FP15055 ss-10 TaxID=1314674 RepID=A0A0D7BQ29_9AGAR|nr:hypothetical protein CYLTODRAFT_367819 [Cylindrobasidium torrendii FP15055 ss-10]
MSSSVAANFIKQGKKIYAIGRNYHEHIKEMNAPPNSEPWFFLKPTTSYLSNGGTIEIPQGVEMHHEVELGVVIGKKGRDVPKAQASGYIAGYALGIDLTARNLQQEVKKKGLPWASAKGFDTFCPITDFVPRERIPDASDLVLWLSVNGVEKQRGITKQMIYDIPTLIEHCSSVMTMEEGDLILTGTPAGALSIIRAGDTVAAGLETVSGELITRWDGNAKDREGGYKFQR